MKPVVWNEKWSPYAKWIEDHLRANNMSPTDWCRMADIHPSTLLRPMHNANHRAGPSFTTLSALASALNLPIPSPAHEKPRMKSLAEITKLYEATGINLKSVVDQGDYHLLTLELRVPKAA